MIFETKQVLYRANMHSLDLRSRNAHDHLEQTIYHECIVCSFNFDMAMSHTPFFFLKALCTRLLIPVTDVNGLCGVLGCIALKYQMPGLM